MFLLFFLRLCDQIIDRVVVVHRIKMLVDAHVLATVGDRWCKLVKIFWNVGEMRGRKLLAESRRHIFELLIIGLHGLHMHGKLKGRSKVLASRK